MPHSRALIYIFVILALAAILFNLEARLPSEEVLRFADAEIKLELAVTPSEQTLGLSGRANLPTDQGLLFVYPRDVKPHFWMKEMKFPIDIIWLDRDYRIVGFEQNLNPNTYPQTFAPLFPVRYVLEVNAGFVDKHHLKVGDKAYN